MTDNVTPKPVLSEFKVATAESKISNSPIMVKGNNPFATGMSVLPGIEILEEPKSKRKPGKKVAKVVQIEKNSSNVSSSDPSGLPSYAES